MKSRYWKLKRKNKNWEKREGALLVRGVDLARERSAFPTRRARVKRGESAHARVEARVTRSPTRGAIPRSPTIPRIDFQSALIAGPSLTKLFVLRDPVAEQPFDPLLPRFNAPPLIVSSPRSKCGVKEANSWSKCRARM